MHSASTGQSAGSSALIFVFFSFGNGGCVDWVIIFSRLAALPTTQPTEGYGAEGRAVGLLDANAKTGIATGESVGTENFDGVIDTGDGNYRLIWVT